MRLNPKTVTLKDGTTLLLRSPESSDSASLLTFLQNLFHESSDHLNYPKDHFDQVSVQEQEKRILEAAHSNDLFILTAVLAEETVGDFSLVREKGFHPRFTGTFGMGVLKKMHSRGLGAAILEHAVDEARRLGFQNIHMRVRSFNTSAIRLYESVGFARVGELINVAKLDRGFVNEYIYQYVLQR